MSNQVLKVSTETCQQPVVDAVKISNIFAFHKAVYQHVAGEVEIFVSYTQSKYLDWLARRAEQYDERHQAVE